MWGTGHFRSSPESLFFQESNLHRYIRKSARCRSAKLWDPHQGSWFPGWIHQVRLIEFHYSYLPIHLCHYEPYSCGQSSIYPRKDFWRECSRQRQEARAQNGIRL